MTSTSTAQSSVSRAVMGIRALYQVYAGSPSTPDATLSHTLFESAWTPRSTELPYGPPAFARIFSRAVVALLPRAISPDMRVSTEVSAKLVGGGSGWWVWGEWGVRTPTRTLTVP